MMPGYTSPDCLPYFLCTDSPCLNTGTECEPSTVFCDLIALVDTKLTEVDDIIGRTTTAVPFAKVARNATFTSNNGIAGYDSRIVWDTVVEDNFNMVDLDANSKAILVRTPGLYVTSVYVVGTPPPTVSNILNVYVGTQVGTFDAQCDSLWRSGTTYNNLVLQRQITDFDINVAHQGAFPVSTIVDFQGTIGTGIVTVTYAEMTVYWFGDVP